MRRPRLDGAGASYNQEEITTNPLFIGDKQPADKKKRPPEGQRKMRVYRNLISFTEEELQLIIDSLQAYYRHFNRLEINSSERGDIEEAAFSREKQAQIQALRNEMLQL
jgi:hypothetical protein